MSKHSKQRVFLLFELCESRIPSQWIGLRIMRYLHRALPFLRTPSLLASHFHLSCKLTSSWLSIILKNLGDSISVTALTVKMSFFLQKNVICQKWSQDSTFENMEKEVVDNLSLFTSYQHSLSLSKIFQYERKVIDGLSRPVLCLALLRTLCPPLPSGWKDWEVRVVYTRDEHDLRSAMD